MSLTEAFRNSPYRSFLYTAFDRGEPTRGGRDWFHPNSLQVIDTPTARAHPTLEAGEWLVSLRYPSAIVGLDPSEPAITSLIHGRTHLQHSARAYPDGTMSVFDNYYRPNQSAVRVFIPSGPTRMTYTDESFFTGCCGRVERTEAGWLITLTEQSRILEIDEDGDVVWDYVVPEAQSDNPPAVFQARTVRLESD